MFDVEAAFLNSDLDMKCFIEWPDGMQEFGSITGAEKQQCCIELKKAMYGNIDSPLRWMKTFTGYLKNNLIYSKVKQIHAFYINMTRKER
jgi:Reverse transcriptase (RNA-dependent DNA polymerase)